MVSVYIRDVMFTKGQLFGSNRHSLRNSSFVKPLQFCERRHMQPTRVEIVNANNVSDGVSQPAGDETNTFHPSVHTLNRVIIVDAVGSFIERIEQFNVELGVVCATAYKSLSATYTNACVFDQPLLHMMELWILEP